ncbi:MAG TPA: pyridoxamine 5'-phosphate oxidase family protein [Mycobacteriales bacterium]|nr:pyridoxamine 5'-phosphate oxidase family protein [Mycobacteriales bacterium]
MTETAQPSVRQSLAMSDDEVTAFLGEGRRAQVATCGADGWPHVVPLSYMLLDGQVSFWTDGESQKVANLRRDARISVLVERGNSVEEFRAVLLRGYADVDDGYESSVAAGCTLFTRYSPVPLPEEALAHIRKLAHQRVTVRVQVEKVVSWDHRKGAASLEQLGR